MTYTRSEERRRRVIRDHLEVGMRIACELTQHETRADLYIDDGMVLRFRTIRDRPMWPYVTTSKGEEFWIGPNGRLFRRGQ